MKEIHLYGTSHVSRDSIELIDEAFSRHDPDIVALELDPLRLQSLLDDEDRSQGPLFLRLISRFQDFIGKRTGLMPGRELLYAYERSVERGNDVALIDQDIRITVDRLRQMSRKEKVKVVLSILAGFVMGPFGYDPSVIPEQDQIDEMVEELEEMFPQLYTILFEERNRVMTENLKAVREENPGAEIVAFVGASHRKPVKEALEDESSSEGEVEEG
ncbi:MAG: TraB/GumN family protein [Candidatus Nanohaloarchaea archaeon]